MRNHLQEYLDCTPGGMMILMDILFHEECTPNEPTMCSAFGPEMEVELERVKKLLEETPHTVD